MSNQNQNLSTKPADLKSLSSQIDDIAIHYILKQNTIDLLRLTDKEYYDNLIVLVGNLFENKLSDLEIGSMNQRIHPETMQDAVLDFLPSNSKIKNIMIRNISKFYMKIMMVFSAIVATIDPQYSYEDDQGTQQLFYLKDLNSYKNIPRNANPLVHQLTNPMNLCRKRITILRNKIDLTDPDFVTINPGEKLCSSDSAQHLTDEIGIKELDLLYYDIFDPSSKTWKHRSKEMEEKYKNDLQKFYSIFTGNESMPSHILTFKDIELFDYRSTGYCKDTLFTQDYIVPKDDELIIRYKEQLELLEKSTVLYRAELLNYLKTIFLTKIEENNMSYTIDPSLTMDTILKLETDTRNTIINLYTNCEQYFIRALLIFEELYDNQSKNMNESRLSNMRNIPLYKESLLNLNQPIPNRMNMNPSFNMTVKPNGNAFSPSNLPYLSNTTKSIPFSAPLTSPDPGILQETIPKNGEPVSAPEPIPFTAPEPIPFTAPEPIPFTAPATVTVPEPIPFTAPATVTVPEPIPFTAPEPVTAPEPIPFTAPEPVTAPEPIPFTPPAPEPVPFTAPVSMPAPEPMTTPEPMPFTPPAPEPIPFTPQEPMSAPEPVTGPESVAAPTNTVLAPTVSVTESIKEPVITEKIPEVVPFKPSNKLPEPATLSPEPIPVTLSPEPDKEKKNSIFDTFTQFLNKK